MDVVTRIAQFLQEWPDAEWGPGHIVLSDYNLLDNHLDYCIALTQGALGPGASEEVRTTLAGHSYYIGHSKPELAATLDFLRALRAIPEGERC